MGSAGFFASNVFSFFVALVVWGCGDFLFFEAIFVRMVTSFSSIELVTLLFIILLASGSAPVQYMDGCDGLITPDKADSAAERL